MASLTREQWRTIGKLVAALVAAGVLGAGLLLPYVGGVGLAAGHEANKFLTTSCNITESKPPEPSTIYARDGKTVIARVFTQDRQPIPLSQVPKYLQQALVATEDRRFYSHHGVDMRGLMRSAVSTSGGSTQGGSTLTMQYVKQIRYFQASEIRDPVKQKQAQTEAIAQNLNRKIEDAKCALYFENTLHESKEQILENYLNIAFFGENAYGIQSAAETYFSKPASQLTLPESALLVGILRAPSTYDPFTNRAEATARRNEVIQNLVAVGDLSQADAAKYEATPLQLSTQTPPPVREGCANSGSKIANVGFFCDYVVDWLTQTEGINDLSSGGYDVITTLDPKLQGSTQQGIFASVPDNSPMTEVLPVVDPKTGDVLAMATSKKYGNPTSGKDKTHTSLHIFSDYIANGSSTYKLFPLLAALNIGVPTDWKLGTPSNGKYVPQNCTTNAGVTNDDSGNEHFNVNETLATATAKSSNTYFVGLADQLLQCDLQPILDVASHLGMKGLQQIESGSKLTVAQQIAQNQRAAQLVLGDVATSPLEITGAYAAIANDGVYNAPAPVLSIKQDGKIVAVKRSPGVQAVAPVVAREAVDILTGDTKSGGTSASKFGSWYATNKSLIAGKTGTAVAVVNGNDSTSQNSSLWFVGLTPDYVATSALINFDNPFAPVSGLPGTDATHAYGAYASGTWLAALQSSLQPESWTWQPPDTADGAKVPDVTNMEPAQAKRLLTSDGYKVAMLGGSNPISCASNVEFGKIAYYGPHIAPKGSTITLCPSLGFGQEVNPTPPPPKKTNPAPTKPTTHHSSAPRTTPTRTTTKPQHGHGHGH